MKRSIALILAAALCLSLAACGGGTQNPDHEYVLSLMERGEYDMAISVLENLRDQANGGAAPAATEAPTEAPTEAAASETTVATEAPTEAPQIVISGQVQTAAELVKRFMDEKGNALMEAYEKATASKAREISVSHAMEYRLGNWDSFNVHFMLVCLDADLCTDGIYDRVYLLMDMDSGNIYDSTMLHDNIPDPAATIDDVCLRATGAYMSYIMFTQDFLWADMESREELSAADIAAINEALK